PTLFRSGVGGVAAVEHPGHVDVDDRLLVAEVEVAERTGAQDPGVVDQHVQGAAGVGGELLEPGAPVRGVADVEAPRDHGVAELVGQRHEPGDVDVVRPDAVAGTGEPQRDRPADARRRARHHHGLRHGASMPLRDPRRAAWRPPPGYFRVKPSTRAEPGGYGPRTPTGKR